MDYAELIASMLRDANWTEQSHSLAGISPEDLLTDEERAAGVEPPLVGYAALEKALQEGLIELRKVLEHTHEWDYGDSEADPVRCTICGADGLA